MIKYRVLRMGDANFSIQIRGGSPGETQFDLSLEHSIEMNCVPGQRGRTWRPFQTEGRTKCWRGEGMTWRIGRPVWRELGKLRKMKIERERIHKGTYRRSC